MTSALSGKRIVNTRAAHQAEALDALLQSRGAIPLAYPCIAIATPVSSTLLDAALVELVTGHFDWLVLTSANTVNALAQRLSELQFSLPATIFRTAAIGPATAKAAFQQLGLSAIDLPDTYIAEALADHLPIIAGARVLLPTSAIARPVLAQKLTERGAQVRVVDAYETVCATGGMDLTPFLTRQQVDALTFTSSSTVSCFVERLKTERYDMAEVRALCAACIGPKTADTARAAGFAATIVATEQTLEGLIEVLEQYFALPTATDLSHWTGTT